ncbi:MAG: diguanylate cyclase [Desulfobacterales bacterium]
MNQDQIPEYYEKADQIELNKGKVLSDKPRILIVDDDKINQRLLNGLLSQDYTIEHAEGGRKALKMIEANPPDLILLDIMMPEMDGFQVIRILKNNEMTQDIPVIFITALNSVQNEEEGLKLGAVDYIKKPFIPSIVKARIRNILTMVRHRKLLETLAHIDGLTEIPNRRYFDLALQREWHRALRYNDFLSVAIADVDYFKQFNDNYGHASGDKVLISLSKEIRRNLKRPYDLVSRYGGEEFGIILPKTSADKAFQLCETIRSAVQQLEIVHQFSSVSEYITISIGGATLIPSLNADPSTIVEKADNRLYEAKNSGRNRVAWE